MLMCCSSLSRLSLYIDVHTTQKIRELRSQERESVVTNTHTHTQPKSLGLRRGDPQSITLVVTQSLGWRTNDGFTHCRDITNTHTHSQRNIWAATRCIICHTRTCSHSGGMQKEPEKFSFSFLLTRTHTLHFRCRAEIYWICLPERECVGKGKLENAFEQADHQTFCASSECVMWRK